MSKKNLGQFFTTNQEYILQNLFIPEDVKIIIEPFYGKGDLMNFIKEERRENLFVEAYDISLDSSSENVSLKSLSNIKFEQRDTIKFPPEYRGKFVLTNPPYLARNKSKDKFYFDKYQVNDLFKCLIKELSMNVCQGGILILPLNFWSSIRNADITLRKNFLEQYDILHLNIFEERVFEDTSYTICSFQFQKKINSTSVEVPIKIYPSSKELKVFLNESNNFMIGGEIYKLIDTKNKKFSVSRYTKKTLDVENVTNIFVKCIDDISLSYNEEKYLDDTPKSSCRTFATLVINPKLSIDQQLKLIEDFNNFLGMYREKYNSLFLTNYRESSRKRISFELVYSIVEYILSK